MKKNEDIIHEYISDILKNAEVKSRIEHLPTANHGSSTGEYVDVELFWDTLNYNWTIKSIAYENYVISKLKPIIYDIIKTENI